MRALRAYWRQRQMQIRYAAGHVQHMQKALEQMNVKLTEVVSSITGLTGMSIIGAILAGERDPQALAACAMTAMPQERGRDRPGLAGELAARTPLRTAAGV